MKWGVRRYENPDGTLTEAGKKRYNRHLKNKAWRKKYAQDVKRVTLNSINPKNHLPHKGLAKEYVEGALTMHPIVNRIRYNRSQKSTVRFGEPRVITLEDIQRGLKENEKEIARLKAKGVYPSEKEFKRIEQFQRNHEKQLTDDTVKWYMDTFGMTEKEARYAVRADKASQTRREFHT